MTIPGGRLLVTQRGYIDEPLMVQQGYIDGPLGDCDGVSRQDRRAGEPENRLRDSSGF